ncbi:probable carboxylesterase 17 [Salvia miltiorrhiza]|uniref:probable carboxylesterase 17 n=1 Tax=Salvia miltiorrhiza TaxID=226208 RepID=UPI0025AC01B7|nr:probable carboxylesterase 17 [Salvia miltiorrhiza]
MSLIAEAPRFLQVFSDGSVVRAAHQTAACSATSKDVTVDPSKPITARIFLPAAPSASTPPLPVLVYFHGGGFCIGTTTWLGYHHFLENLSAAAGAIVLSVDYRLAPENKLPAAYDDGSAALEWLSGAGAGEPWLRNADLSRVFLAGDSAGGNIAHHLAVNFAGGGNFPANIPIRGILPIHPYFGAEAPTEGERAAGAMNDMFWKLSLPEGADRDSYGCNFESAEAEWGLFPATAVFVAGLDFLRERGVMYADFLKKKGVKNVRLIEAEGENHVFHAWNPNSEAAVLLQNQIKEFMQSL